MNREESSIVAYKRFVEWRIVRFALDGSASNDALAQLRLTLFRSPEAEAAKAERGDINLIVLMAAREAEQDRPGPVGGLLWETSESRLYEILIEMVLQRLGRTSAAWLSHVEQLAHKARSRDAAEADLITEIHDDVLECKELLDAGRERPKAHTGRAVSVHRGGGYNGEYSASVSVGDTTITATALIQQDDTVYLTTEVVGTEGSTIRAVFVWDCDESIVEDPVRYLPLGRYSWVVAPSGALREVRAWVRPR